MKDFDYSREMAIVNFNTIVQNMEQRELTEEEKQEIEEMFKPQK